MGLGLKKVFKKVGNFAKDTVKLGVQGILMPVTALNGGKSVLGPKMQPTTKLGKLLDKAIDKVDALGHKVGQIYVKGITGGIVDLSKGGILQKGGIAKTIDFKKLANRASKEVGVNLGESQGQSQSAESQIYEKEESPIFNQEEIRGIEDVKMEYDKVQNFGVLGKLGDQLKDWNIDDILKKVIVNATGGTKSPVQTQTTEIPPVQTQIPPIYQRAETVEEMTKRMQRKVDEEAGKQSRESNKSSMFKDMYNRIVKWKQENPVTFWIVTGIVVGAPILIWVLVKYVFKKKGGKSKKVF